MSAALSVILFFYCRTCLQCRTAATGPRQASSAPGEAKRAQLTVPPPTYLTLSGSGRSFSRPPSRRWGADAGSRTDDRQRIAGWRRAEEAFAAWAEAEERARGAAPELMPKRPGQRAEIDIVEIRDQLYQSRAAHK